jgi:hypothetical protein
MSAEMPLGRFRLAADSVAQVQHPVALDHCVRVLKQMLGIDRPEVRNSSVRCWSVTYGLPTSQTRTASRTTRWSESLRVKGSPGRPSR